ncbi:MAG: LTA synthase family protein [Xanthomonadales bacterium]|nr:LTA synthase family protein [Xanthomonadales bacterium]
MRSRYWLEFLMSGSAKLLLVASAMLALVWMSSDLDGRPVANVDVLLDGDLSPWTNALPVVLLMMVVLGATRRLALSLWLSTLALSIVYGISELKVAALDEPLARYDFLFLGQLGAGDGVLVHYLPWGPHFLFRLAGAAAIMLALAWLEPPLLKSCRALRAVLVSSALVAFASLVSGTSPWRLLYAQTSLDYRPWETATQNSARMGMISNIVMQGLYAPSDKALVSDPAPGEALFDQHREAIDAAVQQPLPAVLPDIVVVQSESYFDPAIMNGFEAEGWLPELRRLQRIGAHGNLLVPTYGGGTIRTEFEVLTGLPLAFFPDLQYPYLGLKDFHIPGLPQALRSCGYETLAIHPNFGHFWNRVSVFGRMGFDRFFSGESVVFEGAERRGYYVADHELTRSILNELPDSGPPRFIFAISMQAHGPYANIPLDESRAAARDAIKVPDGVSPKGARVLRNFLVQLADADRELGHLADSLAVRERPTLLIFYGDHLPGLGEGYALGFKDGRPANQQGVPYLLINSQDPRTAEPVDLPSWMLASRITTAAGVHDDAWFILQQQLLHRLQATAWTEGEEPFQQGLASLAMLRLHDRMPTIEATSACLHQL